MEGSEWGLSSYGRVLCQQYIAQRSLKAGASPKKLRSLLHVLMEDQAVEELGERLMEIIHIMETLNPSIYDSCSSKLKLTMSTDEQVKWTYEKISTELLKTGVNWGKLISIFTVCGTLAADCVSQGHTDFLPVILDCFEESCSQPKFQLYLNEIGGWKGVIEHYDSVVSGQKKPPREKVASLVSKSVRVIQSLSHRVDVVSAAMLLFLLFVMTISITKHIYRAIKMPS